MFPCYNESQSWDGEISHGDAEDTAVKNATAGPSLEPMTLSTWTTEYSLHITSRSGRIPTAHRLRFTDYADVEIAVVLAYYCRLAKVPTRAPVACSMKPSLAPSKRLKFPAGEQGPCALQSTTSSNNLKTFESLCPFSDWPGGPTARHPTHPVGRGRFRRRRRTRFPGSEAGTPFGYSKPRRATQPNSGEPRESRS